MKSAAAELLCFILLIFAFSGSALGENIAEGENTCMLATDKLPESPAYPRLLRDGSVGMNDETAVNDFNIWWDAWQSWQKAPTPQREALFAFFQKCTAEFSTEHEKRNPGVSPLSLFLALDTLRGLVGAEGEEELTAALSYDELPASDAPLCETLRWDDGETACIPGASLWLNADAKMDTDNARALAETKHISVYRREKNDAACAQALRTWVNAWTKGQFGGKELPLSGDSGTTMLSSLYFSARWVNPFDPARSIEGIFHTADGDVPAVYLNMERDGVVYQGESFTAVSISLAEMGEALFLLPKTDVDPASLLADEEVQRFLRAGRDWEERDYAQVSIAVPKLNVNLSLNVKNLLEHIGISAVFGSEDDAHMSGHADLEEAPGIWLGDLLQIMSMSLDEWGVNAAPLEPEKRSDSFPPMLGILAPSDHSADFILDRPFLWAILGRDRLPLYVGILDDPS